MHSAGVAAANLSGLGGNALATCLATTQPWAPLATPCGSVKGSGPRESPDCHRAGPTLDAMSADDNRLFYGDNLVVLREHIASESVDLIYLDPPFNSNRSYNVLFKSHSGEDSQAQIEAFDDTWRWSQQTAGKRPNLPSAINPYKQAKPRGSEQLSLM